MPLHQRLSNFLLVYRTTPNATTNRTPSELFMGHALRTRLDLLRPTCDKTVERRQAQQKTDHDRWGRSRELHVGQQVMAPNVRQGVKWVTGVIIERLGPLTYLVQVDTGQLWKGQLDHLCVRGNKLLSGKDTRPQDSEWNLQRVQNLILL